MQNILDSKMVGNADWSDENTRIVCELFAEEVKAKNRSGTHLNKIGYTHVIAKFKEITGIDYDKLQFKNKWDNLRIDYTNWKNLLKETGLDWDNERKTVKASEEWWKKAIKVRIQLMLHICAMFFPIIG